MMPVTRIIIIIIIIIGYLLSRTSLTRRDHDGHGPGGTQAQAGR
jgi:hypothetical protein